MKAKKYDVFSLKKDGTKLVKDKKLPFSLLTEEQAETLNAQKQNTLIEYVLVPEKVAKKRKTKNPVK